MEKGFTKMTNEITTTNSNAIANAETNNFAVPTGFINTFDISTNEGKNAVLKAYNGSVSLNAHVGEELHICDCITMPGIRKGRNGAPDMQCQNTYLIDTDGIAYFSQSDGIARSVQMFAALYPDFGKSTEDGYLSLVCVSQELPNGNTIKNLIPFDEA